MATKIYPSYYNKKLGNLRVTCYDVIELMTEDIVYPFEAFCIGNVIKYLWRYKMKNGIEDLMKAQTYLTEIINKMESDGKCNTHTEDGTTHTGCAST